MPGGGKTCVNCNKLNHFAKVCYNNNTRKIDCVEQSTSHNDFNEQFFIESINFNSKNEWTENLLIYNGKSLLVKLESGAQCNVFPLHIFKRLMIPRSAVLKSYAKLTTYNGSLIKVIDRGSSPSLFP